MASPVLYVLTTDMRIRLGLAPGDSSEDDDIEALIEEVSAAIDSYCGRAPGSFASIAQYTDYLDGTNTAWLALRQRPVIAPLVTGNTTSGSAIVSGLSSTTNLFVGCGAAGPGIPMQTTITAIGSGQVTLSNAATATATGITLALGGPAVYEDLGGYYGSGSGAFAANTQLTEGFNFAVERDQSDGSSRSGVLRKLDGVWYQSPTRASGLLTPLWARSGSVKVVYAAGYASVPANVQAAVKMEVARWRSGAPYGAMPTGFGHRGQSFSFEDSGAKVGMLSGPARRLLSRYRNISVG